MNTKDLDSLISFKMGLPSLYHIMLGMSIDETNDYEKEIENRQTDNYDLNDFLKEYNIGVERTGFTGEMVLSEITVSVPLEHITERDLKMLFDYFSFRMNVVEKKFNYTSNANDDLCELDILIHSDLYDVKITKDEENGTINISFVMGDETNPDMLRCLAIIANNDKCFAKELFEYLDNVN